MANDYFCCASNLKLSAALPPAWMPTRVHDRINKDVLTFNTIENSKRKTAQQGSSDTFMNDRVLEGVIW
jgi:hypothetical protein